jgi:predicted Zn-dependent protease
MEKLPLTPGPIVPAREQLGELLLQMNQPSDALQQFQAALQQSPGRRNAVLGAKTAAELSNNKQNPSYMPLNFKNFPNDEFCSSRPELSADYTQFLLR